jgi:predicted amidohydrolase
LIIDPWGAILADSGESSEIIFAHAEKPLIKRIRSNLPALQNRRDDIY